MNQTFEYKKNSKIMNLAIVLSAVAVISFLTLILVVCAYTEIMETPVKVAIIIIACILFTIGIIFVLDALRTTGYYVCKACNKAFVPGLIEFATTAHLLTNHRLKCPNCGKKSWCHKVLIKPEEA